jgi:hypothetical protein
MLSLHKTDLLIDQDICFTQPDILSNLTILSIEIFVNIYTSSPLIRMLPTNLRIK